MQLVRLFAVPAVLASNVTPKGAVDSPALGYGPGRCVSIKRTAATGTCMLRTACPTQNIAAFDFSFDCMSAVDGRTTHSLGIGSFDTEDEIDTGVKCDACVPPKGGAVVVPASTMPLVSAVAKAATSSSVHAEAKSATAAHNKVAAVKARALHGTSLLQHPHHKKVRKAKGALLAHHSVSAASARFHKESPEEERGWSANRQVERYGPGGCVSTWKDEESNHCMMRTDCDKNLSPDLAVYEFGLLCRQEDGDTVRHVFGQNSFDEHETFDTLIECRECLALDEYMDSDSAVKLLADEVSELRSTMSNVTSDLNKLNDAVLNRTAPAPAAPAADATNFAVRRANSARRGEQQRGKVAARSSHKFSTSHKASTSHVHKVVAKKTAKAAAHHGAAKAAAHHGAAKAAAHHGAAKKQQKRLLRHTAKQQQEDQDEDVDDDGAEDEKAIVSAKKVGRGQRKSKSTAQKTTRRHRREADDTEVDAESDEQDEEQDQDEAASQEDDQDDGQEEDSASDEDDSRDDERASDVEQDSGEESDAPNAADADQGPEDEDRSESDA